MDATLVYYLASDHCTAVPNFSFQDPRGPLAPGPKLLLHLESNIGACKTESKTKHQ